MKLYIDLYKRNKTAGLRRALRFTMNNLERKSSIDSEPLTLDFNQIQTAREAAISVVNTRSFEEALKIFKEGSIPMVRGKKEGIFLVDYSSDEEYWDNYDSSKDFHPRLLPFIYTAPRDVATAPF